MKLTMKQMRRLNDKTQKEMAKELGISTQSYNAYETYKRDIPLDTALHFCNYFNVKVEDIIFFKR